MATRCGGILFRAGAFALAAAHLLVAGEIEYHATLDDAMAAAQKSHQLVMVILVAPSKDLLGRDLCKLLREETLPDTEIAKVISRHFAPVLIDLGALQAKGAPVPQLVQAAFKAGEQVALPTVLFLDAKGAQVDKIVGYAPPVNYLPQLRKVAEKGTELVPAKTRRDAERALQRAKDAYERKDFGGALEALKAATEGGAPGEQLDEAKRLLDEIQAKAAEKYQQGVNFEGEGKLGSAVRAYQECARTFKGTEEGQKAAKRLVEIRKDPDVRKRLNAYLAGSLLVKAQDAVSAKHYGAAVEALDGLLARYAETEQAAEAKKLREQLNADPDVARQVREQSVRAEAERMLAIADSFRRNGLPGKALAEYGKIIEKFPGTRFSQAAAERVKEIAKER